MNFEVGDKVVCIVDEARFALGALENVRRPTQGEICTISRVGSLGGLQFAAEREWFEADDFRLSMPAPADVGLKFDDGKPRMDLLPMDALEAIAKVLGFGAKKYGDHNWSKGIAWGRLAGAALRHLGAWMRGVELDAESGLPHLHHFGCCALMLIALVLRKKGDDTRGVTP